MGQVTPFCLLRLTLCAIARQLLSQDSGKLLFKRREAEDAVVEVVAVQVREDVDVDVVAVGDAREEEQEAAEGDVVEQQEAVGVRAGTVGVGVA